MPIAKRNPVRLAGHHRVSGIVEAAEPDKPNNTAGPHPAQHACELRELAQAVRRIGCGLRADPETIAIAKDEIACRLSLMARRLEGAA